MKSLKRTLVLCVIIVVVFVCYLAGRASDYSCGIRETASGNYESAREIFTELDGWQDSEVLAEYCRVMAEYDAYDYASVFRSYNALKALDIDNEKLAIEVVRTQTEIAVRYELLSFGKCGGIPQVSP